MAGVAGMQEGRTLVKAAKHGDMQLILELLERGVDVNSTGKVSIMLLG